MCTIAVAKVQLNYNCYNVYFYECLHFYECLRNKKSQPLKLTFRDDGGILDFSLLAGDKNRLNLFPFEGLSLRWEPCRSICTRRGDRRR